MKFGYLLTSQRLKCDFFLDEMKGTLVGFDIRLRLFCLLCYVERLSNTLPPSQNFYLHLGLANFIISTMTCAKVCFSSLPEKNIITFERVGALY